MDSWVLILILVVVVIWVVISSPVLETKEVKGVLVTGSGVTPYVTCLPPQIAMTTFLPATNQVRTQATGSGTFSLWDYPANTSVRMNVTITGLTGPPTNFIMYDNKGNSSYLFWTPQGNGLVMNDVLSNEGLIQSFVNRSTIKFVVTTATYLQGELLGVMTYD